eukprot:1161165-Pelagomonas_calceolata.AAC.8
MEKTGSGFRAAKAAIPEASARKRLKQRHLIECPMASNVAPLIRLEVFSSHGMLLIPGSSSRTGSSLRADIQVRRGKKVKRRESGKRRGENWREEGRKGPPLLLREG